MGCTEAQMESNEGLPQDFAPETAFQQEQKCTITLNVFVNSIWKTYERESEWIHAVQQLEGPEGPF